MPTREDVSRSHESRTLKTDDPQRQPAKHSSHTCANCVTSSSSLGRHRTADLAPTASNNVNQSSVSQKSKEGRSGKRKSVGHGDRGRRTYVTPRQGSLSLTDINNGVLENPALAEHATWDSDRDTWVDVGLEFQMLCTRTEAATPDPQADISGAKLHRTNGGRGKPSSRSCGVSVERHGGRQNNLSERSEQKAVCNPTRPKC